MKPVIAVLPLYDHKRDSLWMLPGYLDGIKEAGGIPLILPYHLSDTDLEEINSKVDGYLFTGGNDVNPVLYNEVNSGLCGEFDLVRDDLEARCYKIARRDNKSILGICRGIQFINVMEGGSLYQDLPTMHPSDTRHHMTPPYDQIAHKNLVLENTPLMDVVKTDTLYVNSYHHQAVKELGKGLMPMAISEDGLVEALYAHDAKFLWALQWHPEFMPMAELESKRIFKAFIDSMK